MKAICPEGEHELRRGPAVSLRWPFYTGVCLRCGISRDVTGNVPEPTDAEKLQFLTDHDPLWPYDPHTVRQN